MKTGNTHNAKWCTLCLPFFQYLFFHCKFTISISVSVCHCKSKVIAEIVNIVCKEEYLAADGKPDVEKMELITFDPVHNSYIALGERAGSAFSDGRNLK